MQPDKVGPGRYSGVVGPVQFGTEVLVNRGLDSRRFVWADVVGEGRHFVGCLGCVCWICGLHTTATGRGNGLVLSSCCVRHNRETHARPIMLAVAVVVYNGRVVQRASPLQCSACKTKTVFVHKKQC